MSAAPSGSGRLLGLSLVASLGGLLFGFDTAVISGTVSMVEAQFALSAWSLGWVVTSALVGCIMGAAVAGVFGDRYGRRPALIVAAILFWLSAVGCAIAWSVDSLVFFRWLGGVGVGIASMLSPLYIAEIAPANRRGRLVALYQMAITVGILLAYFSNAGIVAWGQAAGEAISPEWLEWMVAREPWRAMFGAEALPATLFLLLLFFVNESPRWLASQGRHDEARGVLASISGAQTAERELADIRQTLATETGSIRQLFEPRWRPALIIGLVLPIASQTCGINSIIYYGTKIFEEAGFSLGDSLGGSVSIGVILCVCTLLAMWKVDQLGRRPLLLAGAAGCVLSLLALAACFTADVRSGPGLLIAMALFLGFFAFSLGPIPWIIISEIFPTSIRGRAMSAGTFALWIACAVVSQTFPWLIETVGPVGTFICYASITLVFLVVLARWMPETKGKSLEEIERGWLQRS